MADHSYSSAGPSWRDDCSVRGVIIEKSAEALLDRLENGEISDLSDLSEDEIDDNIREELTNILQEDEPEVEKTVDEEAAEEVDIFLTDKNNIKWTGQNVLSPVNSEWVPYDASEIINPLEPIDYFRRYVPGNIIDLLVKCTNIYALQEGDTAFKPTTKPEMEILLGLHIVMGVINLPRISLYWDSTLGISLFKNSMPKNRFFKLRTYLYLVNNLERDKNNNDKMFKVRPIFDAILSRCNEIQKEERLCVDEQIVPFKGRHSAKQYCKGKPRPWGIKLFLLCGESGLVYDFIIYQGKGTKVSNEIQRQYGIGAGTVVHLCRTITTPGTKLYFDNYFCSYHLLQHLKNNEIYGAGTARVNRFSKPLFLPEKQFKKQERGFMEECFSEDGDVVMLRWFDNKPVVMASNFVGKGEVDEVRRWDKSAKQYIQVKRPEVIKHYNASMGGVDKINFLIEIYRTFLRSRKWSLRMIFHSIDLAICNSWLEYCRDAKACNINKKTVLDLLHFRMNVANALVMSGKCLPTRKRGRPSLESESEPQSHGRIQNVEVRPSKSVRYDTIDHLPIHCGKKEAGRCKQQGCKGRSHFRCEKCNIYLCLSKDRNCFRTFHLQ